jgi:hypothetical protein
VIRLHRMRKRELEMAERQRALAAAGPSSTSGGDTHGLGWGVASKGGVYEPRILELGTKDRNQFAKDAKLDNAAKKELVACARRHKQRQALKKFRGGTSTGTATSSAGSPGGERGNVRRPMGQGGGVRWAGHGILTHGMLAREKSP